MATRLAQVGITLLAAAVVGTAWLLWVGTPSTSTPAVLPQRNSLSARLPANKVAVVLRETGPAGVGAVAQVGDRIDVLAFFPSQGRSEPTTRLLIQDVAVYGSGQERDAGALMVGVSPEQVRLLQEAAQQGTRIVITLRSAHGAGLRLPKTESLAESDLLSWLRRE